MELEVMQSEITFCSRSQQRNVCNNVPTVQSWTLTLSFGSLREVEVCCDLILSQHLIEKAGKTDSTDGWEIKIYRMR